MCLLEDNLPSKCSHFWWISGGAVYWAFAQKVLWAFPTSGGASTKGHAHLETQTLHSVSAMWSYNRSKFHVDWFKLKFKYIISTWKKKEKKTLTNYMTADVPLGGHIVSTFFFSVFGVHAYPTWNVVGEVILRLSSFSERYNISIKLSCVLWDTHCMHLVKACYAVRKSNTWVWQAWREA